jgi:subtilase family serine protease
MNSHRPLQSTNQLHLHHLLVALALAAALVLGFVSIPKADAADMNSTRAQSKQWVYDHRSGKGFRVADHKWTGNEDYVRSRPDGYGPGQIRHAYGVDELHNDGDGQIIGIVSAFHYPTAGADLKQFSRTFGLKEMNGLPGKPACTVAAGPHPCFQVIYAQGSQPSVNGVWANESAIDTQWAHAIAPSADILLVEAADSLFHNLFGGVDVAASAGSSIVSMSWGAQQFSTESTFDHHFNVYGVTFVASAGDTGDPGIYPSASPFVLAVGGTSLFLDKRGRRTAPETAWSESGGGISPYEAEPTYQINYPIPNTGGLRGYPDVAIVADPKTGVAVYDSTPDENNLIGWFVEGGTSVGTPMWAGLTALANQLRGQNLSSNDLGMRPQYEAAEERVYEDNYYDIRKGSNGTCGAVCTAGPGYDFVTGLGSPKADHLIPFLAGKD